LAENIEKENNYKNQSWILGSETQVPVASIYQGSLLFIFLTSVELSIGLWSTVSTKPNIPSSFATLFS